MPGNRPPRLIPFLVRRYADGAAIGAVAVLVAIRLDAGGLGAALAADGAGLFTALLFAQAALLCGAVNVAVSLIGSGGGDG